MAAACFTALGIVSAGCHKCAELKTAMAKAFRKEGYELEFVEILFDADQAYAGEIAAKYGLDDIPSFTIAGHVFKSGFDERDVKKVVQERQRRG